MIVPWQKPLRGAQINPAHPLARGCVRAFLCNELTGNKSWDLTGSGDYLKPLAGQSVSWDFGGMRTTGATRSRLETDISLTENHPLNGSKVSIAMVVNIHSLSDVGADFVYLTFGAIEIQYTISTGVLMIRRETSSAYATYTCVPGQLTTGRHVIIVTLDFPNSIEVYIDGASPPYTIKFGGSGELSISSLPIYLGNRNNEYNYSANATFLTYYLYDHCLSSSDALYLSAHPYCMFRQPTDIGAFEYVVSGGSGPKWNTITPAKWNGVDWSNLKWNGM